MFSRLDPIQRAITRKTEKTDAKLAIRRDESKDFGRSKGGPGEGEFSSLPWEDEAAVSTASLRIFLQSLLGTIPVSPETFGDNAREQGGHAPTTMGSRAVNAYQSMGRAVHDRNVLPEQIAAPPEVDPHPEKVVLGSEFGDADLARVEGYISDLIDLERHGIHELTIQRSMTFLESIARGITEARGRISTI